MLKNFPASEGKKNTVQENKKTMNNLNSLIIEGKAEIKETQKFANGSTCTVLNLTSERKIQKDESEISFFSVYTYGKMAEVLEKTLKNSSRDIRIVGRIKQNRFKDTEGKSHSELVIIAEHIEIKKGTE